MRGASTLTYGTRFYITSQDEKDPCIKGEAFAIEHVREGAEHILEGFDHWYQKSRHSDSSTSPSSATPVKSEISKVLEAITMMGEIFKGF